MKINLIIPMAGESSRFDYKFKPFLKFNDEYFIEKTIKSFVSVLDHIEKVVFCYLKDQEVKYDVEKNINKILNRNNISVKTEHVQLENRTKNQYQTVKRAIEETGIKSNIIVCDCDHSLEVDDFFNAIYEKVDCLIPTWKISCEEIESWSVLIESESTKKPLNIKEKTIPDNAGLVYGCIGCTYFSSIEIFKLKDHDNLSSVISELIKAGKNVKSKEIKKATFYGDPLRLKNALVEDNFNNKIIKKFKGGSFAQTLLVELSSGVVVRKIVDKRKNVDLGYKRLKKQYNDLKRIERLCTNITPQLFKEIETEEYFYYDMEYLRHYEQLSKFDNDNIVEAVSNLLDKLGSDLYVHNVKKDMWLQNHLDKKIYPKFKSLKNNKLLSNIIFSDFIFIDGVLQLGLKNCIDYLKKNHMRFLNSEQLSPTHGDLTFENIMYDGKNIKLIDCDGADSYDAKELDFGKLLQSIISQYEVWSSVNESLISYSKKDEKVFVLNDKNLFINKEKVLDRCLKKWSIILDISFENTLILGYYYMSLHLIRMIPFRLNISDDQAAYAAISAVKYLNVCIKNLEGVDK